MKIHGGRWLAAILLLMLPGIHEVARTQETTHAPSLIVTYLDLPAQNQLYPRTQQNTSAIKVSGTIYGTVYTNGGSEKKYFDSISLQIYQNGALIQDKNSPLTYTRGHAEFEITNEIQCGLNDYQFKVYFNSGDTHILHKSADHVVCGDVFLINGQSNAVSADSSSTFSYQSPWIRTFGSSSDHPDLATHDREWRIAQANLDNGPGAIGVLWMLLGRQFVDHFRVPIALINGAVGGTPIREHLRNNQNPGDSNTVYGRLLDRTEAAGITKSAKALFWYQGENDTLDTYQDYGPLFSQLYQGWKSDYPGIGKIFVFQIRPGCGFSHQGEVRETQRELQERYPDVEVISTAAIEDHDTCHFNFSENNPFPYYLLRIVAQSLYGEKPGENVNSPNVESVSYTSSAHNEIALRFAKHQNVIWQDSAEIRGKTRYLKDAFFLDDQSGLVLNGRAQGDTIYLTLKDPSTATHLTYLPSKDYVGTSEIYEGPWIVGTNGLGALSFFRIPIAG